MPWFGLVQDYIPGTSLQQLLKGGKRFTEAETQNIATLLLNILIYLHELSPAVLHRDIKPSNIIMGENQQVYLVDFGAVQERAKTEGVTFTVVGTGGYAPPEQLWGKAVPASDLYALGATLIHLLTGTPPAKLPQEKMRLQFKDKVSLTPSFANWIEKLCEPAPERRFYQARQALEALQATRFKKTAGTDSLQNAPKVSSFRMGCFVFLYAASLLGALYVSFSCALIDYWARNDDYGPVEFAQEVKGTVQEMNESQTKYYLENGEFAASLKAGDYSINSKYSTHRTPLAAFNDGTYSNFHEKSIQDDDEFLPYDEHFGEQHYIGGVFLVPGDVRTGEVLIAEILCRANISKESEPAPPIVRGNRIECGDNTTRIDGWWPILVSADLQVANRSHELVTAGDCERALQVAQTIKHPYFKAHSLAEIARSYAAAGKNSQAAEIFSLAETVAQTIQHSHSKDIALTDIARSYVAAGQYEQALRVVSSIKDDSDKDSALQAIVRSSTEKGQYEQALRVASSIKDDNNRDSALAEIARSYAEKGQYEQALRAASSIKSDDKRDSALEAIARYSVESINRAQ